MKKELIEKFENDINKRTKGMRFLLVLDQMINVIFWNGSQDETVSSHIGRRSFATNFFGKIPTPLLMAATGHSSEQIFMRYINPVDKDRIISLSNYFNKMYEERLMVV